MIFASGGVIFNNEKLLMIYRNGFWDLPKGKMEPNESESECAVREVKEECGLSNRIKIVDFFQQSYHVYFFERYLSNISQK